MISPFILFVYVYTIYTYNTRRRHSDAIVYKKLRRIYIYIYILLYIMMNAITMRSARWMKLSYTIYNMPTRTRGRTSAAASRTNDTDDIIYMIRSYILLLYYTSTYTESHRVRDRGGSLRANRRRDSIRTSKIICSYRVPRTVLSLLL